MLQIDETIISFDVIEEKFVCHLEACQGACCVEGDSGAPLLKEELDIITKLLPQLLPLLPQTSKNVIAQQGVYYIDVEAEPVISIVNGRECVFAIKQQDGLWSCAIEKLYTEGQTTFQKPISCHLYPVRAQRYMGFTAVNYHRWNICDCARLQGSKLKVPVYRFLKEPLIRKFGAEWYAKLEIAACELTAQNLIKD